MHFKTFTSICLIASSTLGLATPLEKRKNCDSHACITYLSDNNCTPGLELGSYLPDCSGNCFRYNSFSSIRIQANTITGADCIAYSDDNCNNEIKDSGNQHNDYCLDNLNGAKSMRCYYGCHH